eukprot:gene27234-33926_t
MGANDQFGRSFGSGNLNSDTLRIHFKSGQTFTGHFKDDQFHGPGILTRTSDSAVIYSGEWRHGEPFGHGVLKDPRKDTILSGRFYMGSYTGHGTATLVDGTVYTGDFLKGMPHGRGVITDSSGESRREGDWVYGHLEGRGVSTIKGRWKHNEYHGRGELLDSDNKIISKGTYTKGVLTTGYCISTTLPNGDVYCGDWVNGLRSGEGSQIFAPKGKITGSYTGTWLDGDITGRGVWKYASGGVYSGDFLNGLREGQGEYKYTDGEWLDDLPHGRGVMRSSDGLSALDGEWNRGKFVHND